MKICITGTHGTGKTTLLNYLKNDNSLNNLFDFTEEITRTMSKKGIKINEDGDDASQIALALAHWDIYQNHKNLIMDRCLLDVLCYTKYLYEHHKCNRYTLNFVKILFSQVHYDVIFYIEPEFELENDGVRSTDRSFRDEVQRYFNYYIKELNINVVYLKGTVEERLNIISNELKNHNILIK